MNFKWGRIKLTSSFSIVASAIVRISSCTSKWKSCTRFEPANTGYYILFKSWKLPYNKTVIYLHMEWRVISRHINPDCNISKVQPSIFEWTVWLICTQIQYKNTWNISTYRSTFAPCLVNDELIKAMLLHIFLQTSDRSNQLYLTMTWAKVQE